MATYLTTIRRIGEKMPVEPIRSTTLAGAKTEATKRWAGVARANDQILVIERTPGIPDHCIAWKGFGAWVKSNFEV